MADIRACLMLDESLKNKCKLTIKVFKVLSLKLNLGDENTQMYLAVHCIDNFQLIHS